MRGAIGLLLYLAVIVLSGILKKAAQQKSRQIEVFVDEEGEAYTITLEDMLEEEPPEVETIEVASEFTSPDETIEEWEDLQADQSELEDPVLTPEEFSWRQAIVLAEIIREPRAKRPWPSR